MAYVVGSKSQVPRSPSKSPLGGGGVLGSGEGGYPDTLGKGVKLSPLIFSNDEEARRSEVEGMGVAEERPGPQGVVGSHPQVRGCELISGISQVRSLQSSGTMIPF
jgi:hypothetical protein